MLSFEISKSLLSLNQKFKKYGIIALTQNYQNLRQHENQIIKIPQLKKNYEVVNSNSFCPDKKQIKKLRSQTITKITQFSHKKSNENLE